MVAKMGIFFRRGSLKRGGGMVGKMDKTLVINADGEVNKYHRR
jgi:hypothetical protein